MVSDVVLDGKIEDEDLTEIITFYKETFLPTKTEMLKSNINKDEELAKIYQDLSFTESVINGRITVVESEEDTIKHSKARKAANKTILATKKSEKAAQKLEFTNYARRIGNKRSK
jgi:hypothetical protein